jgi:hypothetical protein
MMIPVHLEASSLADEKNKINYYNQIVACGSTGSAWFGGSVLIGSCARVAVVGWYTEFITIAIYRDRGQ